MMSAPTLSAIIHLIISLKIQFYMNFYKKQKKNDHDNKGKYFKARFVHWQINT